MLQVLPEFLQVEAFAKLSNAIGKVTSLLCFYMLYMFIAWICHSIGDNCSSLDACYENL